MIEKKTEGLRQYNQKKKNDTERKIHQVIDEMKRAKEPINFSAVARRCGVARGTLYNNLRIRERIFSLRSDPGQEIQKEQSSRQLLETKIHDLRGHIRQLEKEKEMLIVQLVMQDDLRRENERLKELLH